ncbi:DUF6199 family natural product biosynthesis protein [Actinoplanes derwentensis]|uniref:DUF6199 domain-containing protein n=1 Tax=Actinoplanes derwentensis TaxID=113562 RepID=A0A1H1Y031_9ACTN|nr:DUF6199 family natural product biosynthesis protein [Actinoplanes derwentensis]GID89773.1 hypothetical protein Ade03nite_86970 [Actinoplanes derwentensis]SDT14366.1 hypothetical protein SAMN04489716_2641 [Actinoplanes derwentensis]
MDGLVLILIPVAAMLLWSVISPRSQWRILAAWSYRDPEANEPSDAAFALTRLGSVVMLAVLVWQVIGLATDSADTDARPAPTPVTSAEAAEQLRSQFGVAHATVVTVPVLTAQPASAGRVKILRHRVVDAAAPPAYVAPALTGQTGTWLVLGVRADVPPAGVRINDIPGPVYVSVFAGCDAACPSEPVASGENFYLVTVRLGEPLARRLVFDGSTGRPAP